MSAEDWNRDEQQVRMRRCEVRDGACGHYPGEKCGRRATWSSADIPGITWMCDGCCTEILRSADYDVEAVDP